MEYCKADQHMRAIVEGLEPVRGCMVENMAALTKTMAILGAMMTD